MRKILLFISTILFLACSFQDKTISKKERKFAANYLNQTRDLLLKDVKNLSDTQLNFKSSPERWSVAECIEHIAITESLLRSIVNDSLALPANPSRRTEVKVSDTTIIRVVTDRSHKSTTPERFRPSNRFGNTAGALKEFVTQRDTTIEFVMTTDADLRDHYGHHGIMGVIDCYQAIILIGAHSRRHTLQIEEVMADPNFPKK
ncbi:MAG: DinB family protein [Chitinophagales bacterium]